MGTQEIMTAETDASGTITSEASMLWTPEADHNTTRPALMWTGSSFALAGLTTGQHAFLTYVGPCR